VYGSREAEQAWNRRRADLEALDNVAEELSEVDRRIDETQPASCRTGFR
jgi:hypothetical protein